LPHYLLRVKRGIERRYSPEEGILCLCVYEREREREREREDCVYSLKRGIPNFHFYGLFTISLLNFPFHFFLQVELFALKLEMIQLKMTRFSFLPNGEQGAQDD